VAENLNLFVEALNRLINAVYLTEQFRQNEAMMGSHSSRACTNLPFVAIVLSLTAITSGLVVCPATIASSMARPDAPMTSEATQPNDGCLQNLLDSVIWIDFARE